MIEVITEGGKSLFYIPLFSTKMGKYSYSGTGIELDEFLRQREDYLWLPISALQEKISVQLPSSVEGKDTDGNPCRIYVGDMVEIETTAGNDKKYAIVSEIGTTIKFGEIRCAFPYPPETGYAWYKLPQVKKKVVSEKNKVGDYKVGEKLLIRDNDSKKVFTATVLRPVPDYPKLIALARFEGTESKLEVYTLDTIDQYVFARDWQQFDELTDEEKPAPMADFNTEIKKMTDHQIQSYGGKIPDDYYVSITENGIEYSLRNGSQRISVRKKSEKEIHYFYWVSDTNKLSKESKVSGLKYLPYRHGKGGTLYLLSNDKLIDHTVGNFTVSWCTPEEYVKMMFERRGEVSAYKKETEKPKLIETAKTIEVKAVNYAKLWKEYSEAVESQNTPLTLPSPARGEGQNQSYAKLIAGIRVADSLGFVRPLQSFYLYLVAINGGLILGPEFRTAEIAEEIRKKLTVLKEEILAKIGKAGEEEIQKADFTQPLKVSKEETKLFAYTAEMLKLDRILRGKKTKKPVNVGMYFGLPVELEMVEVVWQAFTSIFSSAFSPVVAVAKIALHYCRERSRPFPTSTIPNHLNPTPKILQEKSFHSLEKAA